MLQLQGSGFTLSGSATPVLCELLSSGNDTCGIDSSSVISGTADALSGVDTIQLGGATNFSFNADTIGTNFLNFEILRKTGASTVTLTGSAETNVFVDQGTLTVAGSVTNGNGGAIVVDGAGATVQVLAGGSVTATQSGAAGVYVTAANGTLINAGTIQGTYGAYFNGAGSVANAGTISGGVDGVHIAGAGTVTNTAGGVIAGAQNGIQIDGYGTVTNAGTIRTNGPTGNWPAIYLGGGGSVTNQAGGLIDGGAASNAIYITGGAGAVDNAGTISSDTTTIYFTGAGTVTNRAGGLIESDFNAINVGGLGSLTNSGTIRGGANTGDNYPAVYFGNGGTITNQAGGVIQGLQGNAIGVVGGAGTLTNHGTITGGDLGNGVSFDAGGTVTNTGTISTTGFRGVRILGGTGEVTNSGTISGVDYGVRLVDGGTVTNQTGGTISGGVGVNGVNGLTLTNAWAITGTSAEGVKLEAGGTVTNQAYSLIQGATDGVAITGAGSVTNGGVIRSTGADGHAILLNSGGTVTNQAGGTIDGGASSDAIYVSGAGTVTNAGNIFSASDGVFVTQAGQVDNQAGAYIQGALHGVSVGGVTTVTNAGTINSVNGVGIYANGAGTITNSGFVLGGSNAGNAGVKLMAGGTVDNRTGGVIGGSNAIDASAGGLSLTNAGTITGWYNAAVLTNGGSVANLAGGVLNAGNPNAVFNNGSGALSVDNAGRFNAGVGTAGTGVLTLVNRAGGEIVAQYSAIDSQGGRIDVDNAGLLQGAWGVVGRNAGDTVDNTGTIRAGSDGVSLTGGELTNSGVITGGYRGVVGTNTAVDNETGGYIVGGGYGVDLYGVSSLENAGTIAAGAYSDGVLTLGGYDGVRMWGGTVDNQAGGAIRSLNYAGVYSYGGAFELTNAGEITSTNGNGLYLRNTAVEIDNLAGGTISGNNGLNLGGSVADVDNAGAIIGRNGNAIWVASDGGLDLDNSGSLTSLNNNYTVVYVNGGGSVTNRAGGTITGGYDGVIFGGAATVTNAGSITGARRFGVFLNGGGSVDNQAGGEIGGHSGVLVQNGAGSVTNAGTISAAGDGNGVSFWSAGSVTNTATGVIEAAGRNEGGWGVWGGNALSVDNAGRIGGDSGVVFSSGGGLINRAGGVVDGEHYGVEGSAGSERVENAGEIDGRVDLRAGNDTLVMITGGELYGVADGGADTDALVLDGAGEGALDVGQIVNFETQTKIGEGTWSLSGAAQGSAGWSIEAGVLRVSGGQAIGDTAGVDVAEGATFALDADETMGALTGAGTVDLGGSTLTVGADGGDSVFDGVIVDGGLSYVGSWVVGDGPEWGENPPVYSGQEAAALLFGGEAGDFAISTVSNDPNQVNYSAWMDGWGDQQYLDTPAPQNLHVDVDGDGYANPGGEGTSYSAYVSDHGAGAVNYAFREESGSLVKTGAGVLTLNGANTFSGSAYVQQGTLRIGDDERLSDGVTLWVESDATFDLQGYDETVKEARLKGRLAGTGTLTAGEYQLNGAVIDANLGEGVIYTVGGVSTLNGTAGAGEVHVAAGTLALGDDERLDDGAFVAVMDGATFDLAGFDQTVDTLQLNGTLAGTGTLTAGEYWLLGGTVDADLGEGVLLQFEGESLLNGLTGASLTELVGGSLILGASERFDDGALVQVDEDATWALDGWDETIDQLWGEGVVDLGEGGGLTLGWDDGGSTFAGSITGEGTVTKIGEGTLTLVGQHDFDGALVVEGGQVRMAAILAGDLHVNGGLLAGVGEIGGDLKITGGTVSPGGSIGTGPASPAARPTPAADLGVLFTNTLTVSGGTLNFGFAGADLDYASDHIVADGAIHLSGGAMDLHPVSALDQYGFNQQYLLIEGASLTGEFANLSGDFTANAYEGQLVQRLRYDVVPGGVVLEVRRMVEWSEFDPTLQGPVGEALEGTQLKGSDEWAGVLNTLLDLTPEERRDALEDMSGEGVANVTASTLSFGDRFQSVMQGHMNAGSAAGGAGGAGGGTAFAALPFGQGARADVMGGMLGVAEAGLDNRPGGWAEAFVVDSTLKGRGGAADAGARGGGFATGADFQTAPSWRVGFALGFSDMQGDTTDRSTASEGRFWHAGAYASYSDGPWYGGAAFSRLTGDVDVDRQIGLGPLTLDVAGATSVEATNISVNAGRRFMLSEGTELRVGVNGTGSKVKQDAYTEAGAGGLSLNVGEVERQLFVGEIGARLTRDFDQGRLKPYVGAGAAFAGGDLASLANVGFSGAPTGTGTFVVAGAELPSEWARLEAGVAFKPRENVWLAIGYDGSLAERLQEHRGTVKVSFKW